LPTVGQEIAVEGAGRQGLAKESSQKKKVGAKEDREAVSSGAINPAGYFVKSFTESRNVG